MKKRKTHPRPGRDGGNRLRLLVGIAVMLAVVLFFDGRLHTMVESILAYQAKIAAFRTVNSAMLHELEQTDLAYGDIVRLDYGPDGMVTSIRTDMVTVNRLKSRMSAAVVSALENTENQVVQVPVGTLFGNQLTAGRGPNVEIKVLPVGYVQSELYNQFTAAGINQTLHQIMLQTSVQMVAVLPGYQVKTEISTNFCIAETVVVGAIPEGYTVINGDDSSSISKINDYRADAAGR